jgi:hypothetical protein
MRFARAISAKVKATRTIIFVIGAAQVSRSRHSTGKYLYLLQDRFCIMPPSGVIFLRAPRLRQSLASSLAAFRGRGAASPLRRALASVTPCSAFGFESKTYPVEYRGIRYTLRAGIERDRWSVAIHPAGVEMKVRVVNGPREDAELRARDMIDDWRKKHSTQKPKAN